MSTGPSASVARTPRLRCWTPSGVYRPQTDTHLLRRTLRREGIVNGAEVLDLCTGTGILALEAALLGARVTAVDISRRAVFTARCNAALNRRNIRVRHGDLAAAVPGHRFDLVVSNPPYVPSPGPAPARGPARAWDAGADGRLLLDRVCDAAPGLLRPTGALLLVQSHLNGTDRTLARLAGNGLRAEIADRAELPFGRVLRSRLAWLRERGLTTDRTPLTEELVVIRAAHI
ncbi:HemK2/MTQ2 family protein methyltransferase [Streptomyces sp. NPDC056716]|uniref:HemK2/MTQ2 family protein methyltransferase n=1 Tax=unclassified Streptomyces TaxID=2593676 RepID=UPI00367DA929